jgi:hypothetical protein
MKFQVVLLSGLLIAAPALAQDGPAASGGRGVDGTPSDTRRGAEATEEGDRRICRVVADSSTSRMAPRRICRTAEQWRAASRANSD